MWVKYHTSAIIIRHPNTKPPQLCSCRWWLVHLEGKGRWNSWNRVVKLNLAHKRPHRYVYHEARTAYLHILENLDIAISCSSSVGLSSLFFNPKALQLIKLCARVCVCVRDFKMFVRLKVKILREKTVSKLHTQSFFLQPKVTTDLNSKGLWKPCKNMT